MLTASIGQLMGSKMGQQEEDGLEVWLSENATRVLIGVLVVAVAVSVVVGGVYGYHLSSLPIEANPEPWGQLGDYFGGILNPIFGFLSVFALLVALVIQSRELRLSREALKLSQEEQAKASAALDAQNKAIQHQSFEQTFFAWLGTYRELVESAEVVFKVGSLRARIVEGEGGAGETQERRGRRALHRWWQIRLTADSIWNSIKGALGSIAEELSNQYRGNSGACLTGLQPGAKSMATRAALDAWEKLYSEWEYQLDSLFRTLYRLLQWIDSQSPKRLTNAQKWLYVSIVRSQLSWIELVFLFYNGHTHRGQKLKVIAEKYALFDNLTFTSDAVITLLKDCPPDGKGYAPSAYESRVARVEMGLPETVEEALVVAAMGPTGVLRNIPANELLEAS